MEDDERSEVTGLGLLSGRCLDCDTGSHERCEGYGVSRCGCYCQDLPETEVKYEL